MNHQATLTAGDPEIAALVESEQQRQANTLSLIAAENHTYPEVLATSGTVLTDKYAEGYPGRRYYAGQVYYDRLETLAIERAKAVFRAEHANVQPLSGSPMNQAVYFGLLDPGDSILAMDLTHGGHLTHGAPASHMGRTFKFQRYQTHGPRGDIDFDEVRALARQYQPRIILCGHSSYPRELDYGAFQEIAQEVGAYSMADVSHVGGLVAGGALRNPLDDGFDVLTTTTHKTLRGPRGGLIACKAALRKRIDQAVFPGLQGGPHMHQIAGIAVALAKAATPAFAAYAQAVLANAQALAAALIDHEVPLITGGTENHLLVLDVASRFDIDGAEAQSALESIGLVTNKQLIPDDPRPPMRPSGLRIGTPAVTTRGMTAKDMRVLADAIVTTLEKKPEPSPAAASVKALAARYPIPGF